MSELTVDLKLTDLASVKEMLEELAYLRFFYKESQPKFNLYRSNPGYVRDKYIAKGNKVPEGY